MKKRTKEAKRPHVSRSIPREIPRIYYYEITFFCPINIPLIDFGGYGFIDPADFHQTRAHMVGDKLIFLYRGKRCGMEYSQFQKLQDGGKVKIEKCADSHNDAFIEKKKREGKHPKHKSQNPWEVNSGDWNYQYYLKEMRRRLSLSHSETYCR